RSDERSHAEGVGELVTDPLHVRPLEEESFEAKQQFLGAAQPIGLHLRVLDDRMAEEPVEGDILMQFDDGEIQLIGNLEHLRGKPREVAAELDPDPATCRSLSWDMNATSPSVVTSPLPLRCFSGKPPVITKVCGWRFSTRSGVSMILSVVTLRSVPPSPARMREERSPL